jgi:hypothetical protein
MNTSRARSCDGKKRYYSIAHAERAAQDLEHKQKAPFSAYRCVHCPYFHVGHTPYELREDQTEAA